MSEQFSSSRTLHLSSGDSPIRRCLHGALGLALLFAHYLLYTEGYSLLTGLLLPFTGVTLLRLRQRHARCCRVQYGAERWTVMRGGTHRAVRVLPCSVCLPWVVYLAWRELPEGRRDSLWVFVDTLSPQELRYLRLRLALDR